MQTSLRTSGNGTADLSAMVPVFQRSILDACGKIRKRVQRYSDFNKPPNFYTPFFEKKRKKAINDSFLCIFIKIYVGVSNKLPTFVLNMSNENSKSIVYSHEVIEFVTVAVQYCAFLEQTDVVDKNKFVDTILKMLPLLYIKGVLVPKFEPLDNVYLQDYVTEENYDIVRNNIAYLLGGDDDFLDVFVEDMKYSESPILCTISENLADIYQDLKNFACSMKDGIEEVMEEALYECKCNFENHWGLKVANSIRALHEVKYNSNSNEEFFDSASPY